MSNHPPSGEPEKPKRTPLHLVWEYIGDHVVISPPYEYNAQELTEHEQAWLRNWRLRGEDGVRLQEIVPKDTHTIEEIISYKKAGHSLQQKLTAIFGREILTTTQRDGHDYTHLHPDVSLKLDYGVSLESKPPKIKYGHPSTITQVASTALGRMLALDQADPQVRTNLQSRVYSLFRINIDQDDDERAQRLSGKHPVVTEAIRRELAQVYPDVTAEDVDWMAKANCMRENPKFFTARSKPHYTWKKYHCDPCPVAGNCLEFAIRNNVKEGMWAGLDEDERNDTDYTSRINLLTEYLGAILPDPPEIHRLKISQRTTDKLTEFFKDPSDTLLKSKQMPALEDMHEHYSRYGHAPDGYVEQPPGAGKTKLFTEFIRITGLKSLVLVPSKDLIDQTMKEILKANPQADIGRVMDSVKEKDSQIVITTYDSFVKHVSRNTGVFNIEELELLVLDEAHRALGKRRFELLKALKHIPILGVTATKEYSYDRTLSNLLPHEISLMPTAEAIDNRLTVPFQNILIYTDTDLSDVPISPKTNDYNQKKLAEKVDNPERIQLATRVYKKYSRGRKAIFFCANIKSAEHHAEHLRQNGIRAEAIHNKLSDNERKRIMELARLPIEEGGLEVVTNVQLFVEGTDIPDAYDCYLWQPTLSKVKLMQAAGRALRLDKANPNKVGRIYQAIDKNFGRPPYTFADPEVAQHATYSGDSDISDQLLIADEDFIISDPATVTAQAEQMSRRRRAMEGLPPHGWLTMDEIFQSALRKADITDSKLARTIQADYSSAALDMALQIIDDSSKESTHAIGYGKYYGHETHVVLPSIGKLLIEQLSNRFGAYRSLFQT